MKLTKTLCFTALLISFISHAAGPSKLKTTLPEKLQLTPSTQTMDVGKTSSFNVTAVYAGGRIEKVPSNLVLWSSSNPNIATVNEKGAVTGVTAGTTTIKAAFPKTGRDRVYAEATLIIKARTLKRVQVTPATAEISMGGTQQFTATAHYTNNTTQNVTSQARWSSSNTAVVTIDSNGLATSPPAGRYDNVIITAGIGNKTGTARMTVLAPGPTSITIDPASLSIVEGEVKPLYLEARDSNGRSVGFGENDVQWASGDSSVAVVENISNGNSTVDVRGVRAGSTAITATLTKDDGTVLSATAQVTVAVRVGDSFEVEPQFAEIRVGETQQFRALSTGGSDITQLVQWSFYSGRDASGRSVDPQTIATISPAGLATGVGVGSVTVDSVYNNINGGHTTLTVRLRQPTEISVTPANVTLDKGQTQQFTATATYPDGSSQDITSLVDWIEDSHGIASITRNGLATGVAEGSATIEVSFHDQISHQVIRGSTILNVRDPKTVISLRIEPSNATIEYATQLTLSVIGTCRDGTTQTLSQNIAWAMENSSILQELGQGRYLGRRQGTTTVTVTYYGSLVGPISASTQVTVVAP